MPETPLTAIIVDDEPLARQGLAQAIARLGALEDVPVVTVVASCPSGATGRDAIQSHAPDAVFVDFAMPEMSGLEMLESLEPEHVPPAVVLVTAHNEYALDAFGVRALDYLVKPVPDTRLRETLIRIVQRVRETRAFRALAESPGTDERPENAYLTRIIIPDRGKRFVVAVDDIEWIEGETYYVRVHAGGRGRLLRERMANLEASLDPAVFARVHRSAIVRLTAIRELVEVSPYSWCAVLKSGARVAVSKERLRSVEHALRAR